MQFCFGHQKWFPAYGICLKAAEMMILPHLLPNKIVPGLVDEFLNDDVVFAKDFRRPFQGPLPVLQFENLVAVPFQSLVGGVGPCLKLQPSLFWHLAISNPSPIENK